MVNPLLSMFNQNNQFQSQPQSNMLMQFQQFLNNFRGDPRQKVQELLNNGQMTQEQFNQFSNIANQLVGKK